MKDTTQTFSLEEPDLTSRADFKPRKICKFYCSQFVSSSQFFYTTQNRLLISVTFF